MSVLLNDTMFMKQSIEIYPEWEKDSYPYNKEKTNVSFSFQLNGKEQKATVNYYRTDKVDETMATTFAFLNNKELPIQTQMSSIAISIHRHTLLVNDCRLDAYCLLPRR